MNRRITSAGFQQLSDEQWSLILSLMDLHLPPERGVPRSDLRKVWNSLLFVLTRGCRWIDLPRDFNLFVPRSTAHGWLKTWSVTGVFDKVMSGLLQIALQKGKLKLSQLAINGSPPHQEEAKKSITDIKARDHYSTF